MIRIRKNIFKGFSTLGWYSLNSYSLKYYQNQAFSNEKQRNQFIFNHAKMKFKGTYQSPRTTRTNMDRHKYYKLLGLKQTALPKDIKTAYYNLAKLYHPDAKQNEKEAKEHLQKFQEINEAYKILGDESKRFEYDKYGFVKGDTAPSSRSVFKHEVHQTSNLVVKVQEETRSKEIPVPMTFMQSVHGITKEVNIKLIVPCDFCSKNSENSPAICSYCNGKGYQVCKENKNKQISCKFCQRSKYGFKNTCIQCGGYGNQTVSKRIHVKIPPNSINNDIITIKHPFEDEELHLILKLENNEQFKIVGLDIFSNVYIPFTMAILGGYISMPTIYGAHTVKIQAATDMNTIIRLPGKGVKKEGGQVGDHVATIIVKMPRSITERQRSLLETFVAIESNPQEKRR